MLWEEQLGLLHCPLLSLWKTSMLYTGQPGGTWGIEALQFLDGFCLFHKGLCSRAYVS